MKIICKMFIKDIFKLSTGETVIIGSISPDIKSFIPNNSSADLYINEKKITTINIIGEDILTGGNPLKREGIRSVRTNTKISEFLNIHNNNSELVIYMH